MREDQDINTGVKVRTTINRHKKKRDCLEGSSNKEISFDCLKYK